MFAIKKNRKNRGQVLYISVVMLAGDYVAYFALTENISWWRGVFLSENPLEFTISE